jgi:hypothetical protein
MIVNSVLLAGALRTMASGAFGGILFWTTVFPADVVKSRLQVSGSKQPSSQLFMQIFRQEGESALKHNLNPKRTS